MNELEREPASLEWLLFGAALLALSAIARIPTKFSL
jgi:hypothetical protein